MRVYLTSKKSNIAAVADYVLETKECIVKQGSILSENIATSKTFKGSKAVSKAREGVVEECKLLRDVLFNSPSTAANFVTGNSTNGILAWKNENGIPIRKI